MEEFIIEFETLLEWLPVILVYIVSGFIFIQVFNFIATTQNPNDFTHVLLKSIIVGFGLVSLYKREIPQTPKVDINIAPFLLLCCVAALILGHIYTSNSFNKICKALKIRRTVNKYIWYDIKDKSQTLWVRAINYEMNIEYLGILVLTEDFQRNPSIVLTRYTEKAFDSQTEIVNYTKDRTKRVLINTEKYDRIEFVYDEKSINILED